MEFTPVVPRGLQVIESYGAGMFRVSGVDHAGSVLVLPERVLSWPVHDFAALSFGHFAALTDATLAVDILLLGCGSRMEPVPPDIRDQLRPHGIAVEPMDTGAACRTYNVLLAEGRHVAAALIAL